MEVIVKGNPIYLKEKDVIICDSPEDAIELLTELREQEVEWSSSIKIKDYSVEPMEDFISECNGIGFRFYFLWDDKTKITYSSKKSFEFEAKDLKTDDLDYFKIYYYSDLPDAEKKVSNFWDRVRIFLDSGYCAAYLPGTKTKDDISSLSYEEILTCVGNFERNTINSFKVGAVFYSDAHGYITVIEPIDKETMEFKCVRSKYNDKCRFQLSDLLKFRKMEV